MEENKIMSAPSVDRNSVLEVAAGQCDACQSDWKDAGDYAKAGAAEYLAAAIRALKSAAPQQVDAVQAVPEGYVLARETVVEMPDGKNELGYTLLSGVGIFTRETEVHDAIKELNLPLGWVSMTTQQLLPGWMLLASPSPAVPTEPKCAMCNDSGVVGRHPDDFQECPDCIAARTAAQGAVPEDDAPLNAGDIVTDGISKFTLTADNAMVHNALKNAGRPVHKLVSRAPLAQTTDTTAGE